MKDVEEVWNIIEKYKNTKEQSKGENNSQNTINSISKDDENKQNGSNNEDSKKPKKKKFENNELGNVCSSKKQKLEDTEQPCENLVKGEKNSKKKKKNKSEATENPDENSIENGQANPSNDLKKVKKKKFGNNGNDSVCTKDQGNGEKKEDENRVISKKSKRKKKINESQNQNIESNQENEQENLNGLKSKTTNVLENSGLEPKLTADENSGDNQQFDFAENILNILQSKDSITLKKLEKKVLKLYLKHSGESECSPKIVKKFNKKLKKITNVHIVDDVVSISTK